MPQRPFSDAETAVKGRRNLLDVARTLDALGVTWWIEAGTFLGCIREAGRFIGHDCDIDVGVVGDEKADEIITQLQSLGFSVNHVFGRKGHGYEIAFMRDDVKVDVFFFYVEAYAAAPRALDLSYKVLWMGCWLRGRMIRLEFPAHLILPTIRTLMEQVIVNVPADAEGYLVTRYGPDWRTPDEHWDWALSPHCINWGRSEISEEEAQRLRRPERVL